MQHILIDAISASGGGAVQVALSIIKNASREKNYKWDLAINSELNNQMTGISRSAFGKITMFDDNSFKRKWNNSSKLKGIVEKTKPDLVYTLFGPAYWKTTRPHLQGFAHPLLIYPVKDWYNPRNKPEVLKHLLINPIKRLFFPKDGFYVVETQTVKERLGAELSIPGENVFVVRNSVSPFFRGKAPQGPGKKRPKNDRFRIFVPSAYYSHKNLEVIPLVTSEMVKRGFSDFEFVFIIPEQNKGWKNIRREAEKFNIQDKIVTLGTLPHGQMSAQYRRCDLVFLPTLVEASTAVYPESFMANKPLITSNRAFARELCGNGALYVDPRNPLEMAEKILVLRSKGQLREKLVKKGFRALKKNYPSPEMKWKNQLQVIEALLNRVDPH